MGGGGRCPARRNRPHRRRAAEQRNELAPPHGGPSSAFAAARYHTVAPERRCASQQKLRADVANGSQNANNSHRAHVGGSSPDNGHCSARLARQLRARKRHMHRSKQRHYSITSSATARSDAGMVSPNVRAVSALMTSSNFEACTTGRSAGFVPLRTRPVYAPTWRHASRILLP